MNQVEITDTFEMCLILAGVQLKGREWLNTPGKLKFTQASKSYVNKGGDLFVSLPKWEHSDDVVACRKEISSLLCDLHTGFVPRDQFLWQKPAQLLGIIKEVTARDMYECKYCGIATPLTNMCPHCYNVDKYIRTDVPLARFIMEDIIEELES